MEILRPDDWHVHFRSGDIAKTVVPFHNMFNRCTVMPNVPPITSPVQARTYYEELMLINPKIEYVMSIMLCEGTHIGILPTIHTCKLYPRGVTTGSEHGITDITKMGRIFEAMEKKGLILSIHAEDPNEKDIFRREESYITKSVDWVVKRFPGMRVIIEHVSSAFGVDYIESQHHNVAGTITAHHLELTYSDTYGSPHNVCCPCPKSPADRVALIQAAIYSNRFFFGSDSAPHLRQSKEGPKAAFGVFMPGAVALNVLINIFYRHYAHEDWDPKEFYHEEFEQFTAIRGANFYKLPITTSKIRIEKCEWTVSMEIGGIVPYRYGQQMKWTIHDIP